ncbi:hypothetical protein [Mycoplasma parvum]|uniref:Uncharacterized protein n=1 Tax=Mycoplasma parvum str. Indiana TaxID=1403316 RepID=U5NCT6_9MOLU|nr:hypothetical protein [Mycoplasma parvum]AGX89242.1 hypothetical protein PRV_02530 [Mycoplasma parvum str. Indiana]
MGGEMELFKRKEKNLLKNIKRPLRGPKFRKFNSKFKQINYSQLERELFTHAIEKIIEKLKNWKIKTPIQKIKTQKFCKRNWWKMIIFLIFQTIPAMMLYLLFAINEFEWDWSERDPIVLFLTILVMLFIVAIWFLLELCAAEKWKAFRKRKRKFRKIKIFGNKEIYPVKRYLSDVKCDEWNRKLEILDQKIRTTFDY